MVPVSVLAVPLVTMLEVEEISGIWQGVCILLAQRPGWLGLSQKNYFIILQLVRVW